MTVDDANSLVGDFVICSSSSEEALNLKKECNVLDVPTIHIITDGVSEPSLFQRISSESETTLEELNSIGSVVRILIGPDNSKIVSTAKKNGWDDSIWSGIVISDVSELIEFRKVYPIYTS